MAILWRTVQAGPMRLEKLGRDVRVSLSIWPVAESGDETGNSELAVRSPCADKYTLCSPP
ncbi:hypothetical protein THTE_0496 [Thermogutta terrifontis]|uniref:Uncharacterized protein n=1 Tax=Thermogutta terrifontis TaxID=1331910 RepID=A0A286RAW3_9BACT|nr:hypothetical protein THTE_0496 [Thermogutta terrifontis]